MINKFDELAKGMAQSVTRRQALKKFSLGLAGMALACFGVYEASGQPDRATEWRIKLEGSDRIQNVTQQASSDSAKTRTDQTL